MTSFAQHRPAPASAATSDRAIAAAYNQAGDRYLAYADGDAERLFAFDGRYSYGDRQIWDLLDTRLRAHFVAGAQTVRILDLGCGPGTWLRRIVTRARELGYRHIIARGIDIAEDQVRRARQLSAALNRLRGVDLTFEAGSICEPLAEADGSVDLCLCLCGVLNHLSANDLPPLLSEIRRVTRGDFITTVRAVGSPPSVYVGAIEDARKFHQDHEKNRLEVEFQNGRRISMSSHLYNDAELRALVSPHLAIKDIFGLDLFHGRFADDSRWNPNDRQRPAQFCAELDRLERIYCRDRGFIDHAAHLLLVGMPHRKGSACQAGFPIALAEVAAT